MDPSTARVELRLRATLDSPPEALDWQIVAGGVALPLRRERDALGEVRVFGLRYRSFVPGWGLHPTLSAQTPVRLRHAGQPADHSVTLHAWHPAGEAYVGLPEDLREAQRRRAERVTLEVVPRKPDVDRSTAPAHGPGANCLDLRCLPD